MVSSKPPRVANRAVNARPSRKANRICTPVIATRSSCSSSPRLRSSTWCTVSPRARAVPKAAAASHRARRPSSGFRTTAVPYPRSWRRDHVSGRCRGGGTVRARNGRLVRNDPAQYDELADEWWQPSGGFAALHWLSASRAEHIPRAATPEALLVDRACGGGLMAPHVARLGYRHVGVDIGLAGLRIAREHGVAPVRGSVLAVPLVDGCADVVLAGEVLEHVEDDEQVIAECARLLRPGGVLVLDAIARTRLADLIAVRIGERVPGGPPPGIHDPAL